MVLLSIVIWPPLKIPPPNDEATGVGLVPVGVATKLLAIVELAIFICPVPGPPPLLKIPMQVKPF